MRKALLFLGVLNDADLDWMIGAGSVQTVAPGTRLVVQGEPMEQVYLILDGCLQVTIAGPSGHPVEVARLRSGDIVGEMSFVDSRPPSATVVAAEESQVLAVPTRALRLRLEQPDFAGRFYRALAMFLADRLRTSTSHLGYGSVTAEAPVFDADDLDPEVVDTIAIAGARFDWMLRRLRGH